METPCPHCGQPVPEEASFCLHCFSKINIETAPINESKKTHRFKQKYILICAIILLVAVVVSICFIGRKEPKRIPDTTAKVTQTTQKQTAAPVSFHYKKSNNGIIITSCNTKETTVTIPDKIDSLPVSGIESNAIGNRVLHLIIAAKTNPVTIDNALFANTPQLQSITLPARFRLKQFPDCLAPCRQLESVTVQTGNPDGFYTENGVVYKENTLVFYPPAKKDTAFTIPENVTSLKESAFHNSLLTTLTFNKSSAFDCNWQALFAALPQLESIRVYPGSSADLVGAQYFSGEIVYYE